MNIETFMPYIWSAVVVFSVILEAITSSVISILFLPSAIFALVAAFSGFGISAQTAVFFAMAGLLLLLRFTVFRKKFALRADPMENPDAVIGEEAVVCETIRGESASCGKIKFSGKLLPASSFDREISYAPGDMVRIIGFKDGRFICK